MNAIEATAEVFMTAFRALPKEERKSIVERLIKDKEFMDDLTDIVIFDQRKNEPSHSLEDVLILQKSQIRRSIEKELTLELEFDTETGEYVTACPELDLASAGETKEEAIDNLLDAMKEYAEDYLERLDLFAKSPNRNSHLPFILLIASCISKEDIMGLLTVYNTVN
jgi:predicted RNase H-like HicB family nuclease